MSVKHSIAFRRLEEVPAEEIERIMRRQAVDMSPFVEKVRPVVEAVRTRGDEALLEFTEKFDGVVLPGGAIEATAAEKDAAKGLLDPEVGKALKQAARNIRSYHESLMPHPSRWIEVQPGILVGEKIRAIPSVGLYVPRGKGSFPSVVMMTTIPAAVAGVPEIHMVTPPEKDGTIDPAVLAAAAICGVERIYKVGGAQAVAALAYGTQTIPRVAKILGPGSPYVAAAMRLVADDVDVGVPAGPSESVVLADAAADPALAAADLLIEAEHGPDSWAFLVTDAAERVDDFIAAIAVRLESLPAWRRDFAQQVLSEQGGVVLAASMAKALEFVNRFAPEHLEILTRDPFETLTGVQHAGEVMLGAHTPISLANYAMGPNAVLPTGGRALTRSPLSPLDFLKRMTVAWASETGFSRLSDTVIALAEKEGFPAHAQAIKERVGVRS
jgi:histidinol dehydrogenase